jgi:hypothetical protein
VIALLCRGFDVKLANKHGLLNAAFDPDHRLPLIAESTHQEQ